MLNNPVFAKSVVGRTGKFAGAEIILPLYFPLIIRTDFDLRANNKNAQEHH